MALFIAEAKQTYHHSDSRAIDLFNVYHTGSTTIIKAENWSSARENTYEMFITNHIL